MLKPLLVPVFFLTAVTLVENQTPIIAHREVTLVESPTPTFEVRLRMGSCTRATRTWSGSLFLFLGTVAPHSLGPLGTGEPDPTGSIYLNAPWTTRLVEVRSESRGGDEVPFRMKRFPLPASRVGLKIHDPVPVRYGPTRYRLSPGNGLVVRPRQPSTGRGPDRG